MRIFGQSVIFTSMIVALFGLWWFFGRAPGDTTQVAFASAQDSATAIVVVQPTAASVPTITPVPEPTGQISPIFSAEVQHWIPLIVDIANEFNLDPDLVATIMQIESCGYEDAESHAGAQGLFQVMPFHFGAGERMKDPQTNAFRGAKYMAEGMAMHGGDTSLTMAGYNGGHGTARKAMSAWPNEMQRYYYWGTGIYADAKAGKTHSERLDEWMRAGGASLCQKAAARIGQAQPSEKVSRPLLPPISGEKILLRGDGSQRVIALTFDIGQTPHNPADYDYGIQQVLEDNNVPATVFLGGDWMRTHPEQACYLFSRPDIYEIGNHGWAHIDMEKASVSEMVSEINDTQDIMWQMYGWQTNLFRLPFGTYRSETLDVIAQQGLWTIQWDIVSGDPDMSVTAKRMSDAIIREAENGSIVVLHMNGRGWNTAEALPRVITELRQQGYEFAKVSDVLELSVIARGEPTGSCSNNL